MENKHVVAFEEVTRFMEDCLVACGTDKDNAVVVADVLRAADYSGFYTHGIFRLELYTQVLRNKVTIGGGAKPKVVKETLATAIVDGNKLLGAVVGKFSVDLAIEKAKKCGIGMVTAKNSNHIGLAAWYSLRASDQGLLGICMTNTSPAVVPTRAKVPTLGTNPISIAAPAKGGDSFVLDMSTSAVSSGKIDLKKVHQQPIPSGWAVDKDGKECLEVKTFSALSPLGGPEESGGYKGYGLGMMVEVLTSVLAGSLASPFLIMWKTAQFPADFAHCFIVIDPNAFEEGFEDRMKSLIDHCRNLEPVNGATNVMVPGDPEKAHKKKCDELGGIPYNDNQLKILAKLSTELNVQPLKILRVIE